MPSDSHDAESVRHPTRLLALAKSEIEAGFPNVYLQATVILWSSLEVLVREFVATWLAQCPSAWQSDRIQRLKVRLGDFQSLELHDRCLWIVDLLDTDGRGEFRPGVERFESILQTIGLSGAVEGTIAKSIFECSQLRNAIVHRRAIADRALIDACPWLEVKKGDRLTISGDKLVEYHSAALGYVRSIMRRVRAHFNPGSPE